MFVPKKIFFTKGVGTHKEELRSFELALRRAQIEKYNLVMVSSIYPPNCKIVSRAEGVKELSPGQIVYCVMARAASDERQRLVAASIGCAIPNDKNMYGYLSEHHAFGETEKIASDYSEDLAAAMLATTLGIEFDEDESWDQKKQVFRISNKIVKTRSTTQTAVNKVSGVWSTVVSCAVLLP